MRGSGPGPRRCERCTGGSAPPWTSPASPSRTRRTPTRGGADLLLYCWGFCAALSGHHRSEDRVLFPRLAAARPELAPVVAELVRDHNMIEHLLGGLRRAIEQGASPKETLRHLDGVEAAMLTHVRYEERRLLDVLDDLDRLEDPDGIDVTVGPQELFGPLAG